jgi:hypothetical protein
MIASNGAVTRKLRSIKIDFHEKPNVGMESGAPSSVDDFTDTALFQEPNKTRRNHDVNSDSSAPDRRMLWVLANVSIAARNGPIGSPQTGGNRPSLIPKDAGFSRHNNPIKANRSAQLATSGGTFHAKIRHTTRASSAALRERDTNKDHTNHRVYGRL